MVCLCWTVLVDTRLNYGEAAFITSAAGLNASCFTRPTALWGAIDRTMNLAFPFVVESTYVLLGGVGLAFGCYYYYAKPSSESLELTGRFAC